MRKLLSGALLCIALSAGAFAATREWLPIKGGGFVIASQESINMLAGAVYIGPSPDRFLPYFVVVGSSLCGGKNKDVIATSVGASSIVLLRGPRVATKTTCSGDSSITSPQTRDGVRVVSGYFINGKVELSDNAGNSVVYFRTDGIMDHMIKQMTEKQSRGI